MGKLLGTIFMVVVLLCMGSCMIMRTMQDNEIEQQVVETDWKSVFTDNGFSEAELAEYEEMFTTVGITDYHDVDITENGAMHIVRGKIYDAENLQLNVTLENRKIILIELAGIPATDTEAYINWRGNVKFRTVDTTKAVDLYYDVDGGYLAKLDWDTMTISAIE